jgi:predicted nucleic acid-binding protein
MPRRHRINAAQAMLFVGDICERLSLVTLSGNEYLSALKASSDLGVVGGGIYDALLARCATKAQAETVYSWNTRHYAQCGPDATQRLRTP